MSQKQILVLSGKGGTGKTTITASFARIDFPKILLDADVDAANLSMLTGAKNSIKERFIDGQSAIIDSNICTACGECFKPCSFNAIIKGKQFYSVDSHSCEGCKVCQLVCPVGAITMEPSDAGFLIQSETEYGRLFHGQLSAGRDNSGKMVSKLREMALKQVKPDEIILIDGPPGIGCQTIASLTGVDYVVIVTEPSLSAIHDMERLYDLISHFGIKSGVIINRFDINESLTGQIKEIGRSRDSSILGKIPFDRQIYEAVNRAETPFDINPNYKKDIKNIFGKILKELNISKLK